MILYDEKEAPLCCVGQSTCPQGAWEADWGPSCEWWGLLNIIFSDKFANFFATRGKSLDKEELNNGFAVDKLLFIDVMVAYNDSSNAAYGKLAYSSVLEGWSLC